MGVFLLLKPDLSGFLFKHDYLSTITSTVKALSSLVDFFTINNNLLSRKFWRKLSHHTNDLVEDKGVQATSWIIFRLVLCIASSLDLWRFLNGTDQHPNPSKRGATGRLFTEVWYCRSQQWVPACIRRQDRSSYCPTTYKQVENRH